MKSTHLALTLALACLLPGTAVWGQSRPAREVSPRSVQASGRTHYTGVVRNNSQVPGSPYFEEAFPGAPVPMMAGGASCCPDPCRACCFRPLTAVLDGLESALDCLLGCPPARVCCKRPTLACSPPKCSRLRPTCRTGLLSPRCCTPASACDHGIPAGHGPMMDHEFMPVPPPALQDPFEDDPEIGPMPPQEARKYQLWNMQPPRGQRPSVAPSRQPAVVPSTAPRASVSSKSAGSSQRSTGSSSVLTSSRRARSAEQLEPPAELPVSPASRLAPSSKSDWQSSGSNVRRTSNESASSLHIPVNPLRN